MTTRRFYHLALWLPIALPATAGVILGALRLFASEKILASNPVSFLVLVAGSGLYSTLPYGIFAVLTWLRYRERVLRPSEIRRIAWGAPLVIAAVIFGLPFVPALSSNDWVGAAAAGAFFGFWTLLIGYTYVAIIEAARLAATFAGWINENGAHASSPSPI